MDCCPVTRQMFVRAVLLALAGGAVLAGLAVVAVVPPSSVPWLPGCLLHRLTGLHCPGCGGTRAAHAALNGDFRQSIAYNPLAAVIIGVFAGMLLHSLRIWFRGEAIRPPASGRGWLARYWPVLLMTVFFGFAVLRNIPVFPLTLLAPHELTR